MKRYEGRATVLALIVCTIAILPGCGSGENRRPVSGTVAVNGDPVERGVVTFYPLDEGAVVGCEVVDGKYSLSAADGPTPGKYRVEILAFRPTGQIEFDIDLQEDVLIEEQVLPKQYNYESTLEAEVNASDTNHFDFDLSLSP